jgi:hemerythrin
MPIMSWDSSLDVGVEAMNLEHQEILTAMNRVYDAAAQGLSGEPVNSLVANLGSVCRRHFSDEERLMERAGYPERERHMQLHARLLAQLDEHAEAIREAKGRTSAEFFNFLKFWLTSHIRGIDTRYTPYVKAGAAA